jgi:hypothetical protein
MESGTLSSWKVGQGDEFSAGDVLAEIETDKASIGENGYWRRLDVVIEALMEAPKEATLLYISHSHPPHPALSSPPYRLCY